METYICSKMTKVFMERLHDHFKSIVISREGKEIVGALSIFKTFYLLKNTSEANMAK